MSNCNNCQASTNVPPGGLTPDDICNGNYITSDCVIYAGVPLSTIDIENGDTFTTVINNINNVINNIVTGDFSFTITPIEGLEVNGSGTVVTINDGDDAEFTLLPATSTTQGVVSTVDQTFDGCKTTTIWTATDYFAFPSCSEFILKQNNGLKNLFLGFNANRAITGQRNTVIGQNTSIGSTITGSDNIILGFNVLPVLTSGTKNIGIGTDALKGNITNVNNVAVGYQTLYQAQGDGSVAIGYQAGYGTTSGFRNTLVGFQAGYGLSTGYANVLLGDYAGHNFAGATNSVAIGSNAAYNFTGNNIIAIGSSTAKLMTTGTENTIIGGGACFNTTTQSRNTVIGFQSGFFLKGEDTVIVGSNVMNTNIGNRTGNQNTLLGSKTNITSLAIANSIALGYAAVPTKSNQFIVGDGNVKDFHLLLNAYANDAAAGVAGLVAGDWYQITGTGAVFIKQ